MDVIPPCDGQIDRGIFGFSGANRVIQIRTWTDGRLIFEWDPDSRREEDLVLGGVSGSASSFPCGIGSLVGLEEDQGRCIDAGSDEEDGEGEEEVDDVLEGRRRIPSMGSGGEGNLLCAAVVAAVRAGVDLTYADLSDADLRCANLAGARLVGAWLEDADLGRALLSGARLDLAILRGADLERASLVEASLRGADLSRANLDRSMLHQADLSHAILCSAWLDGADLRGSMLADLIVDENTTSTCLSNVEDEDRLARGILDVDQLCRRSVGGRGRSGVARGSSSALAAGWITSASPFSIARRLLIDRGGFDSIGDEIGRLEIRQTSQVLQVLEHLDDAYGQVLVVATLQDRIDVLRQMGEHMGWVVDLFDSDIIEVPAMRARIERWQAMRVLASHRSADLRSRREVAHSCLVMRE